MVAMLRLQDGDDLALAEIMERWQKRVVGYLMRLTGDQTIAGDLAEETFVQVYQSRNRYRPKRAFSTWLFAIATNLARQHFRWLKRHPAISLDSSGERDDERPVADRLDANAIIPNDAAEKDERAKLVKEAVLALPPEMREAVILFQYEDMSYAEIAAVAGCSPKAVETRLYRAKNLLRDKLSSVL